MLSTILKCCFLISFIFVSGCAQNIVLSVDKTAEPECIHHFLQKSAPSIFYDGKELADYDVRAASSSKICRKLNDLNIELATVEEASVHYGPLSCNPAVDGGYIATTKYRYSWNSSDSTVKKFTNVEFLDPVAKSISDNQSFRYLKYENGDFSSNAKKSCSDALDEVFSIGALKITSLIERDLMQQIVELEDYKDFILKSAKHVRAEEKERKQRLIKLYSEVQKGKSTKINVKRLFGGAVKGKYETTEQFLQRRDGQVPEEIIYVDHLNPYSNFDYNADKQELKLELYDTFDSYKSHDVDGLFSGKGALKIYGGAWLIDVAEKTLKSRTYDGVNSFGAKTKVLESERKTWHFILDAKKIQNTLLPYGIAENTKPDYFHDYLELLLSVPSSYAQKLESTKYQTIELRMSLSPCQPDQNRKCMGTGSFYTEPSYAKPYDILTSKHYYLANLNYFALYDKSSKKVLALYYTQDYLDSLQL